VVFKNVASGASTGSTEEDDVSDDSDFMDDPGDGGSVSSERLSHDSVAGHKFVKPPPTEK